MSALRWMRHERGDALIYAALAVFAAVTAAGSGIPSHRNWGAIAAPGYAGGVVLALAGYFAVRHFGHAVRRPIRLGVLALVTLTAVLLPMLLLVGLRAAGETGTSVGEVPVIEASGGRLLGSGSPYADLAELAVAHSTHAYYPYLPAMALFGLPRAVVGASAVTDVRVVFLLASVVLLAVAFALRRWSQPPSIRGLQLLLLTPLLALPVATGGDDVPVLALLILGFVLAERRAVGWAGAAVGVAAAMKLTAWPVIAVLAVALVVVLGWRPAARFVGTAALVVAGFVVPYLVADPDRLVEHLFRFPFGMTELRTPAASPMLGYWIERAGPYGHQAALGLLLVAGALFVGYLVRRPPRSVPSAALLASVGLSLAFVLAPSTRFGYFVYPVVLGAWWLTARAPARPSPEEELAAELAELLRDTPVGEAERVPALAG